VKRAGWATLIALACAFGCAPDQPAPTASCASLADCPLEKVCDRAAATCIAEPENRFLGGFRCTVVDEADTRELQTPAEVVGRLGAARFALTRASCRLSVERDRLAIVLGSTSSEGLALKVTLTASKIAEAPVTMKPFFGSGVDAAAMEDTKTGTMFGSSAAGHVEISGPATIASVLTGYLDVAMHQTANADALFGAPCLRGRADCGRRTPEGGGVGLCAVVRQGGSPMCTSACEGDADCPTINAVCVKGACTKSCQTQADCMAPLECFAEPEGNGCF
jgi:hypothetical protein